MEKPELEIQLRMFVATPSFSVISARQPFPDEAFQHLNTARGFHTYPLFYVLGITVAFSF